MTPDILKIFLSTLLLAPLAAHATDAPTPTPAPSANAPATSPDKPPPPADPYRYKGHVTPLLEPARIAPPPGQPAKWQRRLPFFAQRIIDSGAELPPPCDIGCSYYYGYQRVQMSDLKAAFTDGAPLTSLDFAKFAPSKIRTQSSQLQLGAWLFPFLNLYGIFGKTRGHGDVDINMDAAPPPLNTLHIPTQHIDYDGWTFGFGFTLVGHHKRLFFSIPFTLLFSNVSASDTLTRSINIAPRFGTSFNLGRFGTLTPFAGLTYFYLHANIQGSFNISSAGQDTNLRYDIRQRVTGNWSGLVGATWRISKNFDLILENGFGYDRANIIATLFFRF